ncbi:MAG: LysE family translocator [Pseudolysinimonas sp.]
MESYWLVPPGTLVSFAAIVIVVVAVPGPSVMFTITRALTVGRAAALITVAGNAAGLSLQVVAVAVGLGTVLQESTLAFTILKCVGAAYVIYLGVQAIRHRRSLSEALADGSIPVSPRRAVRDGFVVGATNPKTVAFLVSALPAFVSTSSGHLPLQMMELGCLLPLTALLLDSVWALMAGTAREWLARSPKRMRAVGGASGVVMIGIGASLAIAGRK